MGEDRAICLGCGAILQTDHENEPGYVPSASLFEREDVLCRRCFRLKHYNETQEISMTDEDFFKMISEIRHSNSLVVHLIDLFDIEGSYVSSLPRIVDDQEIVLVGNKVDLLPRSVNKNRLKQWLRTLSNDRGVKVADVFLISSTKEIGIEELKVALERYRRQRDIYIVGTTNVGKSTFINHLLKESSHEEDVLTTSYFPGTTLGFIEIPLETSGFLIDTPGIVNRQQMVHYVSDDELKFITPQEEVKAKVYQLESGQTLFFGGLARLDFIRGKPSSFVCYFSNRLPIHRTKLEKADDLYERQIGELLYPPGADTLQDFPSLQKHSFKLQEKDTDVVFPGLGWVTIKGEDITVEAHSPEKVSVTIRKSFL